MFFVFVKVIEAPQKVLFYEYYLRSPLVPVTFLTLLSATIFSLVVSDADAFACSAGRVKKLNPSPQPEGSPIPLSIRRLAPCSNMVDHQTVADKWFEGRWFTTEKWSEGKYG